MLAVGWFGCRGRGLAGLPRTCEGRGPDSCGRSRVAQKTIHHAPHSRRPPRWQDVPTARQGTAPSMSLLLRPSGLAHTPLAGRRRRQGPETKLFKPEGAGRRGIRTPTRAVPLGGRAAGMAVRAGPCSPRRLQGRVPPASSWGPVVAVPRLVATSLPFPPRSPRGPPAW